MNGLTIVPLDVHLEISKQHFLSGDAYESEINEKNPIGNRGDLARAYGDLMKQMWCGNSSTVAPRHFKVCSVRLSSVYSFSSYSVHILSGSLFRTFPSLFARTLYL